MAFIEKLRGLFCLSALLGYAGQAVCEPHYNVNDYYQVHQDDGRIYVFDDFETYQSFSETGETPYRLSRIGAGPGGETVVFGLRPQDKELRSGLGGMAIYDGEAQGIERGFYAEVVKEGRIFIFGDWADLQSFLQVGEAPFRYTDIGAGPEGKTVVYVLNDGNKSKKPEDMVVRFNKKHPR